VIIPAYNAEAHLDEALRSVDARAYLRRKPRFGAFDI
jgi:glycosyltransferase involved in cell wall biosynthesis